MKITFKTIVDNDSYEPSDEHSVLCDGKVMMCQWEGIEPEDVRFCRNLSSPHDCEGLLKLVIDAVKKGEEVEFEYTEVSEE